MESANEQPVNSDVNNYNGRNLRPQSNVSYEPYYEGSSDENEKNGHSNVPMQPQDNYQPPSNMAYENYQKSLANSMMESGKKQRGKYSCGNCQGCSLSKPDDDCGTCRFCLDKTKFGGNNKLRQKCILKKC